jgi:hypothetical protein
MVTNNSINAGNESDGYVYEGKGGSAPDFGTVIQYPDTTSAKQILYSTAADTIGELSGGKDKIVVTDGAGVPTFVDKHTQFGWSPNLRFGGASTGITYSFVSGKYLRFWNIIIASFQLQLSSKGTATGAATMSIPTTLDAGMGPTLQANDMSWFEVTLDANYTEISARPQTGSARADLRQSGSGQSIITLDDTNFANNSKLAGVFVLHI